MGYDGLMFVEIALTLLAGIEPVCTPTEFRETFSTSLSDDHTFVARAVFDEYCEQIQNLERTESSDRATPLEQLANRKSRSKNADKLFDELLVSLMVLSETDRWRNAVIDLRRTVLLRARQTDNPWPATVWVDIPNIVDVDHALRVSIDSFLMSNADKDRDERFAAIKAKLSGDLKTCQAIENIAMRRWSDYLHIIEPYINESVEVYLYPNLHLDQSVVRTVQWIQIHVDDESVISTAQNQLAIWQTVHSQQILHAWSRCPSVNRLEHAWCPSSMYGQQFVFIVLCCSDFIVEVVVSARCNLVSQKER